MMELEIALKDKARLLKALSIWTKVNLCGTLEELANVIRELADENGDIQGRRRKFNAERMASCCIGLGEPDNIIPYTTLTREYGIRQQALYILGMNLHNEKS